MDSNPCANCGYKPSCPNCGFHGNQKDGARSVDGVRAGRRMGDEPGVLKKECQNIFRFHGLLVIYNTLVRDVAQTKGTKLLSRHYTKRKEFLDDVDSLCTVGVEKNKLIGVITHMDKNEVEFFVENSVDRDQDKGLLTALDFCLKNWLGSQMSGQKTAFVSTNEALTSLMSRDEEADDATTEATSRELQDKAEAIKRQLVDRNADWQVFCISMAPTLEALKSVDPAESESAMQGVVQSILGPQSSVKKVAAK